MSSKSDLLQQINSLKKNNDELTEALSDIREILLDYSPAFLRDFWLSPCCASPDEIPGLAEDLIVYFGSDEIDLRARYIVKYLESLGFVKLYETDHNYTAYHNLELPENSRGNESTVMIKVPDENKTEYAVWHELIGQLINRVLLLDCVPVFTKNEFIFRVLRYSEGKDYNYVKQGILA